MASFFRRLPGIEVLFFLISTLEGIIKTCEMQVKTWDIFYIQYLEPPFCSAEKGGGTLSDLWLIVSKRAILPAVLLLGQYSQWKIANLMSSGN